MERRFEDWNSGRHSELWQDAVAAAATLSRAQKKQYNREAARDGLATRLTQQGRPGKAAQVLMSEGLAPDTAATVHALRGLHPASAPLGPQPPPPADAQKPSELLKEKEITLQKVLRKFDPHTACGPSGLRVQHVLDALGKAEQGGGEFEKSLWDLVLRLADGLVPGEAAEFIAGANLIALLKPGGGVRPIAVGEVLRRIVSMALCMAIQGEAAGVFEALGQYGVGTRGGAEKINHATRECIELHWFDVDFVLLQVDFKNAFNSISREAVIEAVTEFFPHLLPWVLWCYASGAGLWHILAKLLSEAGVQQGDPLGPLLFSGPLARIVRQLMADPICGALLLNKWFLDDGTLAGTAAQVLAAYTFLVEACALIGLAMKPSGCKLYMRAGSADVSGFPAEIKVSHTPNVISLGAPIGDKAFCEAFTESKCVKAGVLLDRAAKLEDPHCAFQIIRVTGSACKATHIMRNTPPDLIKSALGRFDDVVRTAVSTIIGVPTIPTAAWKQAQLRPSRGGLGLPSCASTCHAAYLSSVCAAGIPEVGAAAPTAAHVELAKAGLAAAAPGAPLWGISQHKLAAPIDEAVFAELKTAAISVAEKARLLSVSGPRASAWVTATPNPGLGLHLAPGEFRAAAKLRLGMLLGPEGTRCVYRKCNKPLDQHGHHALTCKHGGDPQRRHNALSRVIYTHARHAGLGASLERGAGIVQANQRRPADVLVPSWTADRDGALDVTVISPHCIGDIVRMAGETAGFAAGHAAAKKHLKQDADCAAKGWVCVPLAVETFGTWDGEGEAAVVKLAQHVAARTGVPRSVAVGAIFAHLSIALQRANARAIQRRYQFSRPALGLAVAVVRGSRGAGG